MQNKGIQTLCLGIFLASCSVDQALQPDVEETVVEQPVTSPTVEKAEEPTPAMVEVERVETGVEFYQDTLDFFRNSPYIPYRTKIKLENGVSAYNTQEAENKKMQITILHLNTPKQIALAQKRKENMLHYMEWREHFSRDNVEVIFEETENPEAVEQGRILVTGDTRVTEMVQSTEATPAQETESTEPAEGQEDSMSPQESLQDPMNYMPDVSDTQEWDANAGNTFEATPSMNSDEAAMDETLDAESLASEDSMM